MDWYREILALHVIAIISWMAGILYLYRLLIYGKEKGPTNTEIHDLLSLMSKRLYKYITVPAMSVAWICGLSMVAIAPTLFADTWFKVKFASALLLTISTIYAGRLVKTQSQDSNALPPSKRLRYLNEVPTLLMIIIVIMVIIKPFN